MHPYTVVKTPPCCLVCWIVQCCFVLLLSYPVRWTFLPPCFILSSLKNILCKQNTDFCEYVTRTRYKVRFEQRSVGLLAKVSNVEKELNNLSSSLAWLLEKKMPYTVLTVHALHFVVHTVLPVPKLCFGDYQHILYVTVVYARINNFVSFFFFFFLLKIKLFSLSNLHQLVTASSYNLVQVSTRVCVQHLHGFISVMFKDCDDG